MIGAGSAVADYAEMEPADVVLFATPDREIANVAKHWYDRCSVQSGTVVFHLSGALDAAVLHPTPGSVLSAASCHPVRSFAGTESSIKEFSGTWCGLEGDHAALEVLEPAFEEIGGRTFRIDSANKLNYHAASVMVSNYLNALVASAIDCYGLAGIDAELARQIIRPILADTASNINLHGPGDALTGPILRGDIDIVERELRQLQSTSPALADVYRIMGRATVELVRKGELLDADTLGQLNQVFTAQY